MDQQKPKTTDTENQGNDSFRLGVDTVHPARRMNIREAHEKALHLIGKWAMVERNSEKYYPTHLPIGPCRIGRFAFGCFFLMAHGKTFEECFEQLPLPGQPDADASLLKGRQLCTE